MITRVRREFDANRPNQNLIETLDSTDMTFKLLLASAESELVPVLRGNSKHASSESTELRLRSLFLGDLFCLIFA
jgi:hypothetical protein